MTVTSALPLPLPLRRAPKRPDAGGGGVFADCQQCQWFLVQQREWKRSSKSLDRKPPGLLQQSCAR